VGSVSLIDMLKEAVLRTGCLNAVTSVADSSSLKPEVLAERLMLAIFGYGPTPGSGPSPPMATPTAKTTSATYDVAT
jgi:hypothetical protein